MKILFILLCNLFLNSIVYGEADNPVKCELFYCTEKTSGGCDPLSKSFPIKDYGGTSAYWLDENFGEFGFSIRMHDQKPNFSGEKYIKIHGGLYVTKNKRNIFSNDIKLLFKAERKRPFIHSDSTVSRIDFKDNQFLITKVQCGYH